jgi:F-type H+-transporting ATPase subunit delta
MAELATIARPYAEALFKAAGAGDLGALAGQIHALAGVAGNAQVREFADNPKIGADQVFEVMTSAVKSPLSAAAKNLLRAIIDNGRLAALPSVAEQFQSLVNARSGVANAVIYSAFAIAPAQLADVVATLEKRFSRKLNPSVVLAPELIGGIRVVVGDEVLDASVKSRLEQMKTALTA